MAHRTSHRTRRPLTLFREFLASEASGGLVLMGAAALALLVANGPLAPAYFSLLHAPLAGMDLLHWINDGLMAVFFLLVGLEIKREMLDGQLATWSRRVLPGIAAAGGMLVPALIYAAFNWDDLTARRGWAIPSATDIAFALGILSLAGPRVPVSLKVFLAALAILDDLGAVVVIALFYTAELSFGALALSTVALAVLIGMNRLGAMRLWLYLLVGALLWALVLKSGVHAALAGVALALAIPHGPLAGHHSRDPGPPLRRLEHAITPWVAFGIVPLFGFANAGVSFAGMEVSTMLGPIPLGIGLGLFFGKQLGVFLASWAAIRCGLADLPSGASWGQLYGTSLLCGVGFTMSLFIGALGFPSAPELADAVKVGVLGGSVMSGLAGWLLLRHMPWRTAVPAR